MTQEEKLLLLKDLCARLPYGVKVQDELRRINKLVIGNADLIRLYYNDFSIYSEKNISLPYLFPLSSMTKEQKQEYHKLCDSYYGIYFDSIDSIDWLNMHHFDYRGLIKKGLAIEVTEENNPYKLD